MGTRAREGDSECQKRVDVGDVGDGDQGDHGVCDYLCISIWIWIFTLLWRGGLWGVG